MALPVLTGTIVFSAVTSTGFTFTWPAGTADSGTPTYDISLNGGFSWPVDHWASTSFTFAGASAGSTWAIWVRARDATNQFSTPPLQASITTPAADTTAPTLTGAITVSNLTDTAYTLAWPAGADNVAVSAYEYSVNGGSTWTGNGTALTVGVTGRTPGATDSVQVRARDAAGNVSTPVLSTSVTLPASGDTTPPVLTGAVSITNIGGTSFTASVPTATDAVGPVSYDYSTDGGTTWAVTGWPANNYNFSGLTSGALIQFRARARDGAGNLSTPVLSATVQLTAAGTAAPQITLHPISRAVVAGQTVALTYAASGSPTPTVQLQRSTNGGVSWAAVSGATATAYTTPVLTLGDNSARYRVVATNQISSTTYTATSHEAVLSVTATAPTLAPILIGVTLPEGKAFVIP